MDIQHRPAVVLRGSVGVASNLASCGVAELVRSEAQVPGLVGVCLGVCELVDDQERPEQVPRAGQAVLVGMLRPALSSFARTNIS